MPHSLFKGLLSIFLLFYSTTFIQGQVITAGPDSTLVAVPTQDTLSTGIFGGLKNMDKPSRAALYSALIPGGGQFYNKRYWKIPIIYAGGITIGYFLLDFHKRYLLYRSSIAVINDGNPATVDVFAKQVPDEKSRLQQLSRFEQNARRYRDYNIIYVFLLYGLNVAEAYVDGHLKGFDISDNLTLKVDPSLVPVTPYQYAPGFALKLNYK